MCDRKTRRLDRVVIVLLPALGLFLALYPALFGQTVPCDDSRATAPGDCVAASACTLILNEVLCKASTGIYNVKQISTGCTFATNSNCVDQTMECYTTFACKWNAQVSQCQKGDAIQTFNTLAKVTDTNCVN